MILRVLVIVIIFFVPLSVSGIAFIELEMDSIGITESRGRVYIIHEIEKGETLYALSKRYNVEVKSILDSNEGLTNELEVGSRILIPYAHRAYIHEVKAGETIYSIARRYGVNQDDLVRWNELEDVSIEPGRELRILLWEKKEDNSQITHVVSSGESVYSISRKYNITPEALRSWNGLDNNLIEIGQMLYVSPSGESAIGLQNKEPELMVVEDQLLPSDEKMALDSANLPKSYLMDKTIERGLAALIEGTADNRKYLALHRSAPVGTILSVENEFNKQVVFVRVIGSLPDTGENDKVVVRITERAWQKLEAVNTRFRARITYFE